MEFNPSKIILCVPCSFLVRRTRNERIAIQGISAAPFFDARMGLQTNRASALSYCYNKEFTEGPFWHEA
jgi:hypothetical protein